jgi:SM-20-related protein
VIKAVVPKPDRLVVFPGTIPHVARPIYAAAIPWRITLMFKTLGRRSAPAVQRKR